MTQKKKKIPSNRLTQRYHSFAKRMHQTDADELLEIYLNSLTTSFDPHTDYMSPSTQENFDIMMRLELEGIGAIAAIGRRLHGGQASRARRSSRQRRPLENRGQNRGRGPGRRRPHRRRGRHETQRRGETHPRHTRHGRPPGGFDSRRREENLENDPPKNRTQRQRGTRRKSSRPANAPTARLLKSA